MAQPIKFTDLANLPEKDFAALAGELAKQRTLGQVLNWAGTKPAGTFLPQVVAEVITQDEYTHDVIIPFRNVFLVFDTT